LLSSVAADRDAALAERDRSAEQNDRLRHPVAPAAAHAVRSALRKARSPTSCNSLSKTSSCTPAIVEAERRSTSERRNTEVRLTHRWRRLNSKFQFRDALAPQTA
jgi:hypothetical protein